jgi:uncharacterized protein YlxW (UPF0749 family)
MKKYLLAAMVLAAPAFAQTPEVPPKSSGQKACELLLNQSVSSHMNDATTAFTMQEQVTTLQKQVADLTKERDDLKAKEQK